MKLAASSAFVFGLTILAVTPVLAHHSFEAEFDGDRKATLTGIVTKIDWTNPHAWVYFNVTDDAGAVKNFGVEMGPPYALVRGGWKRDTVKIGDKITVEGAALAKDGSNKGGSLPTTTMILADGQRLTMR